MSTKLERDYQTGVLEEVRRRLPGCIIQKLDSGYQQGIPDWLILYRDRWATLEIKKDAKATKRPNQPWFVETMNQMSFSAFIYPENEQEVLDDLQQSLSSRRNARLSKP